MTLCIVCGYSSEGYDSEFGLTGAFVAGKLLSGYSVKDSWFYGIDNCFGPPIKLRVIGENEAMLDERIYGYGPVSDPPVDDFYEVRDHDCK
jgi:hypothetical protein